MKNLLKYLFVFLLSLNLIEAQNKIEKVSLTYGEELPDDNQKIVKIIGEVNDKIYALAIKGKNDFFIKIFESTSMKLLNSKLIVIPEVLDKEIDFEEIFLLNSNLYAIGSVYNKKDKTFNLVANQISEDGILSKQTIVLFNSEVAKKSDKGVFYFKQSPDEGALLVMHTALFSKENAVKYEVKLFDDKLYPLFSNTEKVKFDDSKKDYEFKIADFELNFLDDVFLVVNESYRDSKKKEQIEKFEIHTFKQKNGYKKEIININISGREIINCKMLATAKNTFNLSDNTYDEVKFNEFDYQTKVKLIGERRAKKGKEVKPLYAIHSIVEKNDGGLIVLSEFQTVYVGNSSGIGPLAFTPVTYTKNEIIVTCLKPDGSLEWSNVLPKEQSAAITTMSFAFGAIGGNGNFAVGVAMQIPLVELGKGPEYLGAIPIYKNNQLNILFNDNVKNKGITNIEEIKSLGNYNNAVPSLFIFDNNGSITRKDPEEAIKNELVLRPAVYYRKSDKEYIIYASRKKKDKLGRMVLED